MILHIKLPVCILCCEESAKDRAIEISGRVEVDVPP